MIDPDNDDRNIFYSQEQEAMDDERGAELGDPRRCPRHPSQVTSSPDGMFDAPCGACEFEMEGDYVLFLLDEVGGIPTAVVEHYGADGDGELPPIEPSPTHDTLAERDMDKETNNDCPF
jgi:hypothetical protein